MLAVDKCLLILLLNSFNSHDCGEIFELSFGPHDSKPLHKHVTRSAQQLQHGLDLRRSARHELRVNCGLGSGRDGHGRLIATQTVQVQEEGLQTVQVEKQLLRARFTHYSLTEKSVVESKQSLIYMKDLFHLNKTSVERRVQKVLK